MLAAVATTNQDLAGRTERGSRAQSSGIMYIAFGGTNSVAPPGGITQEGVLNCMSIVDLSTNLFACPAAPVNQTMLLDFGDINSFRGTNSPSPDNQGHYWNNLGTNLIGSPLVLTNAAGGATAVSFMFDFSPATRRTRWNAPRKVVLERTLTMARLAPRIATHRLLFLAPSATAFSIPARSAIWESRTRCMTTLSARTSCCKT